MESIPQPEPPKAHLAIGQIVDLVVNAELVIPARIIALGPMALVLMPTVLKEESRIVAPEEGVPVMPKGFFKP